MAWPWANPYIAAKRRALYYVGITLDQALKSLANLALAVDQLSGGAQEEAPQTS